MQTIMVVTRCNSSIFCFHLCNHNNTSLSLFLESKSCFIPQIQNSKFPKNRLALLFTPRPRKHASRCKKRIQHLSIASLQLIFRSYSSWEYLHRKKPLRRRNPWRRRIPDRPRQVQADTFFYCSSGMACSIWAIQSLLPLPRLQGQSPRSILPLKVLENLLERLSEFHAEGNTKFMQSSVIPSDYPLGTRT